MEGGSRSGDRVAQHSLSCQVLLALRSIRATMRPRGPSLLAYNTAIFVSTLARCPKGQACHAMTRSELSRMSSSASTSEAPRHVSLRRTGSQSQEYSHTHLNKIVPWVSARPQELVVKILLEMRHKRCQLQA